MENKPQEEIGSELEWLFFLKSKGIILPEPMLNRNGALTTFIPADGGSGFYSTLLTWIDGERLAKGALTEEAVRKMGEMAAALHKTSSCFTPPPGFTRPSWGLQSFTRDWRHLEQHHRHFITDEAFALYALAAAKVADDLNRLTAHEHNFGMIHADLHIGNLIFREQVPYPIDFGRCGFGFFLYDIAQSIMGLYPVQRKGFLEGYQRIRPLESGYIPNLECFFIMAILETYSFHSENPLETEGLIAEQPYAQALLKAYVDGESFLFR